MSTVHAQDTSSRLADEQAALSQLRIDFVQKVAELDSRIKTLEADLETNQQVFNDLKVRFVQEIASREDRIAELEAQLAESNASQSNNDALSNLQDRLAAEQEALAQLRIRFVQEIAEREAQIQELSQAPQATNETQLAILQNRLTEEQNALAQLRVDYVQGIAEREAQIRELSQSSANNQEANALKARLAEEQEALAQPRVKFAQDIAAAQASNPGEGRIADLEAQIASLTAQLSDAQNQINTLTTELSNAQNAQQPATTSSTTSSTSSSSYLVVSGDTLSSLALRFYGDSSLWGRIATANNIPLETADVLEPGTLLVIPAP